MISIIPVKKSTIGRVFPRIRMQDHSIVLPHCTGFFLMQNAEGIFVSGIAGHFIMGWGYLVGDQHYPCEEEYN